MSIQPDPTRIRKRAARRRGTVTQGVDDYTRSREQAALERRQFVAGAMADPDKAWERVMDSANDGRDLTTVLLLAIAAELHHVRRRVERDEAGRDV